MNCLCAALSPIVDVTWAIHKYFVFPAPDPATYTLTSYDYSADGGGYLLWLPQTPSQNSPIIKKFYQVPHRPYLPCYLFIHPSSKRIVIFSHANGCDIGDMYFAMWDLKLRLDCSVLVYEYEGYGLGPKHAPSEQNIYLNIRTAYNFVVETLGFPPSNVFLFGQSLGSAPSSALAGDLQQEEGIQIGGLILQSPYVSFREIAGDFVGPLKCFVPDLFNVSASIERCFCPVIFLHGLEDRLISASHTKRLFQIYPGPIKEKHLAAQADHNTWEMEADVYLPIERFFVKCPVVDFDRHVVPEKLTKCPYPDLSTNPPLVEMQEMRLGSRRSGRGKKEREEDG
eukprot:TRINITY_DN12355_c0_g1_i1.p1 TRINITY_DN12355_c0_g1~~TRINITY_DN12355_c0_g1_i1.p1  ORF type:complete len:340 (-),score=46.20 TRINITY_DN12355_c0_g1_i1:74-1093(-)